LDDRRETKRMRFFRRLFRNQLHVDRADATTEPAETSNETAQQQQLCKYSELASRSGFSGLSLFLSFDCDTDEDAEAAESLEPWLQDLRVKTTYAVPGEQLERAAKTYRSLRETGATFINHGGQAHAAPGGERYVPVTFYDKMSTQEVQADIRRGHKICTEVLGTQPKGFRAPHFGSIQTDDQLAPVYDVARELGYTFCSTTIPRVALENGPVVERNGICEIPLFGSLYAPTSILDSWTHLEDRKNYRLSSQFFDLFKQTVDFMIERRLGGILSYYVDPAHVVGQAPFLEAMKYASRREIPSVTADDIVARFRQNK